MRPGVCHPCDKSEWTSPGKFLAQFRRKIVPGISTVFRFHQTVCKHINVISIDARENSLLESDMVLFSKIDNIGICRVEYRIAQPVDL